MTATREDVYRSIVHYIEEHDAFAGVQVVLDPFASPTAQLGRWFELQLVSLIPHRSKVGNQQERGTLRLICNHRPHPQGVASSIVEAMELADKVTDALHRKNVNVRDWRDNGGTSTTGVIEFEEVQVDDLGPPIDGVRKVICTVSFYVSAVD